MAGLLLSGWLGILKKNSLREKRINLIYKSYEIFFKQPCKFYTIIYFAIESHLLGLRN